MNTQWPHSKTNVYFSFVPAFNSYRRETGTGDLHEARKLAYGIQLHSKASKPKVQNAVKQLRGLIVDLQNGQFESYAMGLEDWLSNTQSHIPKPKARDGNLMFEVDILVPRQQQPVPVACAQGHPKDLQKWAIQHLTRGVLVEVTTRDCAQDKMQQLSRIKDIAAGFEYQTVSFFNGPEEAARTHVPDQVTALWVSKNHVTSFFHVWQRDDGPKLKEDGPKMPH